MWKRMRRWLRAILLVREIAARTQAEERLAQSEAIWSVDRDCVLLTFNQAFRRQFVEIFVTAPAIGELVPSDMFWNDLYKRALAGERFSVEHEYKVREILDA